MSDLLTPAFVVSVLAAAVAAGTALLYACLGELITERAGILNLGIEGIMLMGALAGAGACIWSGNAWVGALAALLAGALMAAIHAVLTVGLRANQVVSGLALTIFGTGLSAFLGRNIVGTPPPDAFRRLDIPLLAEIPVLGRVLFQQSALVYISFALVAFLWWYIYRTRAGLRLRAIGERPEAADAMGIDVARLRAMYVIAGGALAGLGGAAISLGTNPGWTEGMTAGRGWIAVALVIFAGWNPARAAVGAYLFGGVEAGQFRLQTAGVDLSPFFLNMLPYLFTVLVLVLSTREATRRTLGAPAALGRAYMREERG
ncbi:MAG: ABC transporter permease [Thermomicrobiales bacterium]|nr:ABC transporter permease [Thermomicrobiales bacterium]